MNKVIMRRLGEKIKTVKLDWVQVDLSSKLLEKTSSPIKPFGGLPAKVGAEKLLPIREL